MKQKPKRRRMTIEGNKGNSATIVQLKRSIKIFSNILSKRQGT
jgi:hypothetical protein